MFKRSPEDLRIKSSKNLFEILLGIFIIFQKDFDRRSYEDLEKNS